MQRTSYSRLQSYSSCGEYYRHHYIEKTPCVPVPEEALLAGTLTHAGLETILKEPTKDRLEVLASLLPEWLDKECHLPTDGLDQIIEFGVGFSELLYKASARYRGEDGPSIRNKDGSVPQNLKNYPPASWTQALRERPALSNLRQSLDIWASSYEPAFANFSFAHMLANCFDWVLHFQLPEWYQETLAVEMEFSPRSGGDEVPLPGHEDVLFNGKIDWVFKTTQEEVVICDHKTGSSAPCIQDVKHSAQLALYTYALHHLYGMYAHKVCIHHVPSGQFIVADVDQEVVAAVKQHFGDLQAQIEKQNFTRKLPTEYGSPCLRRDYRSGVVVKTCPYLAHCWPLYADNLASQEYLDREL